MTRFVIEPLTRAHDRRAFTCGVPALDRYLHEMVFQDIKRRVSNCFVALDGASIAGFYTLAASSLPLTELSEAECRRLPRYPLLPACLIGRLAIHERYRGQALGGALVVDALHRALRSESAVFALVVDAKDAQTARFYQHLGFLPFASQPQKLYLPLAAAARHLATEQP